MKKGIIFILAAVAVVIAGIVVYLCGGDGGGESNDTTTVTEEKTEKPALVNVVIDKSASMKGYFNKGNMTPLLNTISEIANSGKKEGIVRFFGGSPIANYARALQEAVGFGKDTDLKAILGKLLVEADTVPVAFITDGIFSSKGGSDDFSEMKGKLARLLKNDKLGYVVYRINSPYNGGYWIEKSRLTNYHSEKITVENRPLYVILMGPKEEVRYFNINCPLKEQYEAMAFNTHESHENLEMYYSDENIFKNEESGYKKINSADSYTFGFRFPECLKTRIEQLNTGNAKLTLNGEELKNWNVKLESGSDNIALLTIPNKGANESAPFDEAAMKEADSELELEFDAADFNAWNNYNSDDDSKIATDISEQSKTFGLKHLIEAFRNAQDNEEVKVTFKFQN